MLSNREKAVLITSGCLVTGIKDGDVYTNSMAIAYKMMRNLDLDMSVDEFAKICADVKMYNDIELEELMFKLSNR